MYESGEIYEVMSSFEKALKAAPVYVGASVDRCEMEEVPQPNGRISKRFVRNNYYNSGNVNALFLLFLHGYASGKCAGRMEAA